MKAPFIASDGFAFANSWPSEPAVTLETPFGRIDVGNAAAGLCGGMVYAALDYWYAGERPSIEQPVAGSPLYRFLVRRIVDSWNIPVGVAQYFSWMNLPQADTSVDILGRHVTVDRGVCARTIVQQWPQVRHDLDQGLPSPLGIVTVQSHQLGDLGLNHQVLAYGYAVSGSAVTVKVYDPNSGQADHVTISFDTGSPQQATDFHSNINVGRPVRGFFRSSYTPVAPPGQSN